MADEEPVLSDEEKEALLSGVAEGVVGNDSTEQASQVRRYEIRPDAHINYGSYPRLQGVCQHLGKRVAQQWSALLKCDVSITADEVYTSSYAGAVLKARPPVITTLLSLHPLPSHSVVILDNSLLTGLVEAFFGFVDTESEPEEATDEMQIRQQFTAGELRVSELLLQVFFQAMPDAWEKLATLSPNVIGREFDPTIGTGIEGKANVVVCRFLVEVGAHRGYVRLMLPESQIHPIADDLEGATNARNPEGDPEWRAAITKHLATTEVSATARVGRLRVPLRTLVALQAGDLLPLEQPEEGSLMVGETRCAVGSFGTSEGHNAFQLARWLGPMEPTSNTRH
ncbi:MAG: FliM/FliN family flagellar motor switch protein [Pseudomonadota bacterium]